MQLPERKSGSSSQIPDRIAYPGLFCVLFLLSGTACSGLSDYDTAQVESALRDSLLTTNESWNVSMTLMEAGLHRITLQGDYAVGYNDENRKETYIDGSVYVQLFNSDGEREAEAWSLSALYHAEDRQFELFDSVRVVTETRRLYTEYLKWSQETDRITSDRFVTIITPSDSLTGSGFSSNTDLTGHIITNLRGQVIVD